MSDCLPAAAQIPPAAGPGYPHAGANLELIASLRVRRHQSRGGVKAGRQTDYPAAAQAFTINELNKRRAGFWDWGTPDISKQVDWEAGTAYNVYNGFRADIITGERWLFEVKIWHGPATTPEVEAQLRRYVHEFSTYSGDTDSVEMEPSSELQGWIGTFEVEESWWDWLNGGLVVYVWGFGLPRGHIYAEDEDDTPEKVRNKKRQQDHPCICHIF